MKKILDYLFDCLTYTIEKPETVSLTDEIIFIKNELEDTVSIAQYKQLNHQLRDINITITRLQCKQENLISQHKKDMNDLRFAYILLSILITWLGYLVG